MSFSYKAVLWPAFAASALLSLSACGGAMSPDKAHGAVVATSAGGSLTGADLERWLLKSPVRPSKQEANVVLSAWINDALIINAIRKKEPLTDSAVVDSVLRPDAARGSIVAFMLTRDSKMPPVTDKQIDSLLDLDRVRVFQQILFVVLPKVDSVGVVAIRSRAVEVAKKLRDGADFKAMAHQYSDDSATRNTGGFLPAVTHEQVANRLEAIWRLRPGENSPVIPSNVGYHILRRATREEARDGLRQWLTPVLAHHSDSLFIDSVTAARHISVPPEARTRARNMAVEPNLISAGGPLATWSNGGELNADELREGILMMTPAERYGLSGASDSLLSSFVADQAKRKILSGVVSTEPPPSAEARRAMIPSYRLAMDSITVIVGRLPTTTDAGATATAYIDSMLTTGRRHLALPGALSSVLRLRHVPSIDQSVLAGVLAGVSIKWQELHKNDSTDAVQKAQQAKAAGAASKPAGSPPK